MVGLVTGGAGLCLCLILLVFFGWPWTTLRARFPRSGAGRHPRRGGIGAVLGGHD